MRVTQRLRSSQAWWSLGGILLTALCGFGQTDPGVRGGPAGVGGPIAGISTRELAAFNHGLDDFQEVNSVKGTIPDTGRGLGPRFNLDSCAGCHAHPSVGGSSPAVNPQIAMAARNGATNSIPAFLSIDGPVREARLKFRADGSRDGGVHGVFTIAGSADAPGCAIEQPDFEAAAASNNVALRIPTPVFGAGLLEVRSERVVAAA